MELKIENIREVSLDVISEANIQKDNIAIKTVANSEKLGWKNYNVEIASKDAGSGKRLEFQATNDNKNILSGRYDENNFHVPWSFRSYCFVAKCIYLIIVLSCFSTSFISKQEGPKTIIEGSGAVKVQDEQKSANFKYIRTILGDGNEKGIEVRRHCQIK